MRATLLLVLPCINAYTPMPAALRPAAASRASEPVCLLNRRNAIAALPLFLAYPANAMKYTGAYSEKKFKKVYSDNKVEYVKPPPGQWEGKKVGKGSIDAKVAAKYEAAKKAEIAADEARKAKIASAKAARESATPMTYAEANPNIAAAGASRSGTAWSAVNSNKGSAAPAYTPPPAPAAAPEA